MTNSHFVSIIIPTYNSERFLRDAILSVLSQSYNEFEIIIVDDGSMDNTREVIKQFERDPHIRSYFLQNNSGPSAARNVGIRESKGDLIAFLDSDDLWTPDKLKKQVHWFDKSPNLGVVYTNVAFINENGTILHPQNGKYFSGKITNQLLIENFVTGMASIVRRECFDAVGYFDEALPMAEDYDLWLRISVRYEFLYVDEVTYLWRRWPEQRSNNYEKNYYWAIKIMEDFIDMNSNILDPKAIKEAWAHTFVGRGYASFRRSRKMRALKDFLLALSHKYNYAPAWKGIIKVVVGPKIISYFRGKSAV